MDDLRSEVARALCLALGDDPDRESERLVGYDAAAQAAICIVAEACAKIADMSARSSFTVDANREATFLARVIRTVFADA